MYNLANWHLKYAIYIKKKWIEILLFKSKMKRFQSVLLAPEIYHYYSFGTAV